MFLKKGLVALMLPLLLVLTMPTVSLAQTNTPAQSISLTDAIKAAQNNNSTLNLDKVNVQEANNSSSSTTSFVAHNGGSMSQWFSAVYGLQNANLTLTYDQNNAIYQTEKDYFSVQDAVYAEQLAEKSLEEAQEAYKIAQVSLQVGTYTPSQVATAKATLDSAQSGVTAAKAAVDAAYVAFDNYVGLDPSERPELTTLVTYDPNYNSILANADQAANLALENNPNAQIQQNLVKEADANQPYATLAVNGSLDYQKQSLSSEQTLQGLAATARQYFLQVSSDQGTYTAAQNSAIAKQATYSDAQANYNAGIYTNDQLLLAEEGNLSAQSTLQKDLHQLLEDKAFLALVTGVGSVTIPVSGN